MLLLAEVSADSLEKSESAPSSMRLKLILSATIAVSGFLAWAISYTNGRMHGWQWLFIIEVSTVSDDLSS